MVRTTLKLLFVGVIAFGLYKGLEVYALLRFGENMQACGLQSRVCPLIAQKAGGRAVGTALNETFTCVASKQSFLEALVLPVKKQITTPSDEPVDHEQAAALCTP